MEVDQKINIKGADYPVVDTGDGYFLLRDFPLMSAVKKGVKGAPKDLGKKDLESYVENSRAQYHDGPNSRCAPAFIRHNPDTEIGRDPDFSGYVLPKRVGKYEFDGKDLWAIFGDVKINEYTIAKMRRGELPAHSPEVSWSKERITGLAFLSTRPPHFEFANNTIGDIVVDHSIKFSAALVAEDVGRFNMGPEHDKDKDKDAKMNDDEKAKKKKEEEEKAAKMMKHGKYAGDIPARFEALEESVKSIGEKVDKLSEVMGKKQVDPLTTKPTNKPIEPDGSQGRTQMEMGPELAAKFSAQENQIAEMRKWQTERDDEKTAAALVSRAETAFEGKVVTDELHQQIANFAAERAGQDGSEEWFDKFTAALKPSLRDKPVASFSEFAASGVTVDAGDKALAKFQSDPAKMERAGKFAAEFRTLRKQYSGFGEAWGATEDERETKYIEQQFALNGTQEGR